MRRRHELELMEDDKQVRAYAEADFEEAHRFFMRQFLDCFGRGIGGHILDLGCGPGHIALRFARTFRRCIVHGVDGSQAMLDYARKVADSSGIHERIHFFKGVLPQLSLPIDKYDVVISNSVLHHVHDPSAFWQAVHRYSREGTLIFVMDLMRPRTASVARALVEKYTTSDSPLLKRDFYNSFLAAFEPGEIEAQLKKAGIKDLPVKMASDRHLCVSGIMSG